MISNGQTSTIAATVEKHRALVVLRCLEDPALHGHGSEELLSDLLDERGLGCTRDRLRDCLRFLEQSALITTTAVGDLIVAHLTYNGSEVTEGRIRVEGVLHAAIGCLY